MVVNLEIHKVGLSDHLHKSSIEVRENGERVPLGYCVYAFCPYVFCDLCDCHNSSYG
jgi:hypothetical protein